MGVKHALILALRSQIFEYLAETFYRHALEYLKPARSEREWGKYMYVFLLGKRLTTIDLFEGLWSD